MTWFKENKFLGGLIVVTVILAGLLLAFGISQKGKKDELLSQVEQTKQDVAAKRAMNPFPNPDNVRKKRNNLKEVVAASTELQESILSYAPLTIENIPVAQFSKRFEEVENGIRALYGEKIFISDDFHLGFERYKGEAPNANATGILSYQLEAFDWMFRELAAAGISDVRNMVRAELAPERGESWGGAKPVSSKKKKKKKKKGRKGSRGPSLPVIAKNLPFELTFSGKESAVRDALSRIANGEKYFVVTRALAAKNPGAIPNNRKLEIAEDEEESSSEEDGDATAGLFDDDEAPAEKEIDEEGSSSSGRILERVAGGEDLTVVIRADLLLFEKSPKFPEIK